MKHTSIILIVILLAGTAFAQPTSNEAAAEAALNQGNALMDQGQYAEACKKFETSFNANGNLSALLNLGECNLKQGHLATARSHYNKLVTRATELLAARPGDFNIKEKLELGQLRSKNIEPRLPHLKFTTTERPPGFTVKLDGVDVTNLIDVPLPVDGGPHEIVASAPKFESATQKVVVSAEATDYPVSIGKLVPAKEDVTPRPADPVAKPTEPVQPEGGKPWNRRKTAIIVGGAGALALVTGFVFGARAKSQYDDAHDSGHCDANTVCDRVGFDQVNKAHTTATISTILTGVGIAAVGAGVVLWVTGAPKAENDRSARIVPLVHGDGLGAAVLRRF